MRIIVDSNIIFSAMISNNSSFRNTLINSKEHEFYSPDFVFAELSKNMKKLLKYCKLTELELVFFFKKITENIHFVPEDFVSPKNQERAYLLCEKIDPKDTPFIALSIELDASLWTGDLKLKKGLIKDGFDKFFNP